MQLAERILHIEFQTRLSSVPPLPLRMLDYWVRLYRVHQVPITQVVVLLLSPASGTVIETVFAVERTRHEYRVICLWEENPEQFLNDPALLPFAPLAASSQPEALLQQVAERVSQLEESQRQEVSAYTELLAGLKFEKDLIKRLFKEDIMQESVIYQEILEKGLERGRQERLEGERSLIKRQLARKLKSNANIPQALLQRIDTLSIEQIENLAEALFDFETIADLEAWLEMLE